MRKIDHSTHVITTIAGTGISGFSGDSGLAVNASIWGPQDMCFDKKGNLLLACAAARVRKIDTAGIITTISGTGVFGYSGDGGYADTSTIGSITGICTDSLNNIYLADGYNAKIFKISATTGIITTIAGTSSGYLYNGDNILATTAQISPNKIRVDNYGNIVFVDQLPNNRIRLIDSSDFIHTIAGNGTSTYSGDNGNADSAGVYNPGGLSFDRCGNLYISQVGGPARIRKVALYPNCNDTICAPIIIDTSAAVRIVPNQSSIRIYPNPVQNDLVLESVGDMASVSICNVIGQTVYYSILDKSKVSISTKEFMRGVYFVQVMYNDGGKEVVRVVKE